MTDGDAMDFWPRSVLRLVRRRGATSGDDLCRWCLLGSDPDLAV